MSVGGGYGASSSSNKSDAFEKWSLPLFQGQVMPFAQRLLSNYDPTGGTLRTSATDQFTKTLNGDYLDPATNPNLAKSADAIQTNASQAFDRALNRVNQGGAANGTLLSSKVGQIQADTARKSAADVANSVTNLYGNAYSQERGLQAGAAGQATNASQVDMSQLLNFLNLLKGGQSKGNTDAWNTSGNVSLGSGKGGNGG